MIRVLTIEREYGSGAAGIAQKLAESLGWKLWDQLLTNEIARRLECASRHIEEHGERKDPLYYRLFKAFLRGSYEGSLIAPRLKMADADGIRRITEQFLHNPVRVEVSRPASTVASTTQSLVKTGREPHEKRETLRRLICVALRSREGGRHRVQLAWRHTCNVAMRRKHR